MLTQRLAKIYNTLLTEKSFEPKNYSYLNFIKNDQAYLKSKKYIKHKRYWLEKYRELPSPLIPRRYAGKSNPSNQSILHLSRSFYNQLNEFAKKNQVSIFHLILGALYCYFVRIYDREDLAIGLSTLNRNNATFKQTVGLFASVSPAWFQFGTDLSFVELIQAIRIELQRNYRNQRFPISEINKQVGRHKESPNQLFDLTLSYEKHNYDTHFSGSPTFAINFTNDFEQNALAIFIREFHDNQKVRVNFEYSLGVYKDTEIEHIKTRFEFLLGEILRQPEVPIWALQIMPKAESQKILVEFNDTEANYPCDKTIVDLFEEQVKKIPDNVAVVFEAQQLTYRELNTKANQLAHYLQSISVKPEVLVGICVERSLEMIIGLLGILKAGGAYLPLEPTYPMARLLFMLEEAKIPVLLTQSNLANRLPSYQTQVVYLDTEKDKFSGLSSNNPESEVLPVNLAYVVYTSGSTGMPKGVMIEHDNILAMLHGFEHLAPSGKSLIGTSICPFSFDGSVWEIFSNLCFGGTLHLLHPDIFTSPEKISDYLREYHVTSTLILPALLSALISQLEKQGGYLTFNRILVGIEPIEQDILQRFRHLSEQLYIINGYGPTETTICATFYRFLKASDSKRWTPIGTPLLGYKVYLTDFHQQLVPIGIPGEILIGGVGLARGYYDRPNLTANQFIPNPFNEPGSRLYRTGDLARYLPDGNIEYLGRLDNQVKIRGFRIELNEIEIVLKQHPKIQENVVVVHASKTNQRLVAYLVPQPGQIFENLELRCFLQEKLPDYMIPSAFVTLEALPLTPNGKIDRKTLSQWPVKREASENNWVMPRTSEEKLLADIWVSVLDVQQVSVYDNFFELGGDSILGIQVISRANQVSLQLKPKHLFQYQTIAELATVVAQDKTHQTEQGLVTGKVPITPIQHWFFTQNISHPHHFNQAVLLSVSKDLTPKQLEPIVSQLLWHHDALRLRLTQNNEQWITDAASLITNNCLLITDLSAITQREQQATIEAIASELQTSLSLAKGPLLRVAWFYLGYNQPNRLLLIIHHFAVDGVSWRILLEDFAMAYQQISQGKTITLPPKTTSFKQWAERLTEYAQAEFVIAELDYWLDNSRLNQVMSLPIDYPTTMAVNTRASQAQFSVSLSVEETQALLFEVPPAYHTQINDILLTAFVQTMRQWTGNPTCLSDVEGHGREELFEDLDLSRTVGWFTSICPVLLDIGTVSNHHGERLKSIKEQLRQIPHQGISYSLLRYLNVDSASRLQTLPQAQILFNYLGQFHPVLSKTPFLGVAPEKIGATQSRLGERRYLFEINIILHNKQLQIDWSYSQNCHRHSTVERLAQNFKDTLCSLIAHCQSPEAGGYTPSDFPLIRLEQTMLDKILVKRQVQDLYPLSPMQEGLLFHTLYAPESGVYFEQFHFTIEGDLNPSAFQQAWQQIINRHTILRTGFVWKGVEKPLQIVYKQVKLPWTQLDWQTLTSVEQQKQLTIFLNQDKQQGFNLTKAPLMRCVIIQITEKKYHFIWSHHHILLDGWCLSIIFKELLTFYQAYAQASIPHLEQPRPYREYIAWLQQQDMRQAEAFWKKQLKGFMAPTPFQVDNRIHQASSQQNYQEYTLTLSQITTEALQSYVRQHHLTLNTIVQGMWALLLSHYSGNADVVFGATVSGRSTALVGVESMLGLFINTLPVRVRVSSEIQLLPWLQQLHALQVEREQYSYTPLVDIQSWSEVRGSVSLFESIMTFENYPLESTLREKLNEHLNINFVHAAEMTYYPFTMIVAVFDSKLSFKVLYDIARFTAGTIERMMGHVKTLLEGMLDDPERQLGELPLLTEAERHQLLVTWNNTHTEYPTDQCIHQLFEAQVELTPEATAIIFNNQQLTYQELNIKANQLAHHLQTLGVKPEVLVGICVIRSLDMVTGLLGILKAGGAYMPLEPNYPQERLDLMLEDSQILVLLTQSSLKGNLPKHLYQVVDLDIFFNTCLLLNSNNPNSKVIPSNLAYVIYTSGSTGQPKGVAIEHQSTVILLNWAKTVFTPNQLSGVLASTSISFDLSVFEIFAPLSWGGSVVLLDSALQLAMVPKTLEVTLVNTVPSTMAELVRINGIPASVQVVNLAGEALKNELVQKIYQQETVHQVFNLYGPSEDTTYSTIALMKKGSLEPPKIGHPIANTQIYILNHYLQPTPIGVLGELHIGGVGLARGYLNHPDYSSKKFIPNPFSDEPDLRLYKTGDLARYLPDGNIEYLGRLDNQVKLRGFRVELGEIEVVLAQHPAVRETVVTYSEVQPNDKRLFAYIVSEQDFESEILDDSIQKHHLEHISQWAHLFDENYRQSASNQALIFNITGWKSSYTSLAIPTEEMREWVDATVNLILSLQPKRVLEIGCGTGLLLSRIAPHCIQYWGTDFSAVVLQQVEQLKETIDKLEHVVLFNRKADDFSGIAQETFDTVILNSVVQYFPSITYLLEVLEKAIKVIKPGGYIFVGDIRHLLLLKAYHTSVQFYQASASLTPLELEQRVQQHIRQEEELLIDPNFFIALQQHNPQISAVNILPKRGRYHNELTRFRYEVILQVGGTVLPEAEISWQDWQTHPFTLATLRQQLKENSPTMFGWRGVPNVRLDTETKILEWLTNALSTETVGQQRKFLSKQPPYGIDPEDLWQLSQELPYDVEISWANATTDGSYDVFFKPCTHLDDKQGAIHHLPFISHHLPFTLHHYANNPLQNKLHRILVPQLRQFLQEQLPEYMVPATFVMLDSIPLTPNGKVDYRALPIPKGIRPELEVAYMKPQSKAEQIIAEIWQKTLGLEKVGIYDNFFDLGGHSLLIVQIHNQLQEKFEQDVSMVDLFQYPTIQALANYVNQKQIQGTTINNDPYHVDSYAKGETIRHDPNQKHGSEIAIIGMSCRFPGANDIEAFWQNLCEGVESISFFSDEELITAGIDIATLNNPNYVKAGTVLSDIEWFDASFFGMSAREAEITDPQHRLFLECAEQSLENAGYDPMTYEGQIGVYASVEPSSYWFNNLYPHHRSLNSFGTQVFIGNDKDFLSTRVSYKLNLKGPSVTVQTACSSSLVAVHWACQSLLSGECDMALTGGVTIQVPQKAGYWYQKGLIFSPDGHCRAFDAKAQGTINSNGIGVVVLKKLNEALADGDYIHAIIKGSAINNDGALKVGYTAPSVEGQAAVISKAMAVAGIEADTITTIEAHGTGTELGDPIEIAALTKAYQASTKKTGFCAIASVKTNIGHTGAAAGVAGLIKTVLMLKYRLLPPNLHFEQPNPQIDFANSPFYVNTRLSTWKSNGIPRRAGVSSFGVGGTNAHVILEEAQPQESSGKSRSWQLLVISAKTSSALETATTNLATYLEQYPKINLADVAYTLSKGRQVFNHRRMLVCQQTDEAAIALRTVAAKHVVTEFQESKGRPVVFMFSGQGTQYINMALALYQTEPAFRELVEHCSEYLKPHLGLDLKQILYPSKEYQIESEQQLNQTVFTQSALFVIEYALAKLWMTWGIFPKQMIGYNIGEYVAACLAGVFSLEDALSLVATHGKMMQQLPHGTMLGMAFTEQVQKIQLSPPTIPYLSNVTGTWITTDEATNPEYWGKLMHHTVLFAEGLQHLLENSANILLEIGPGQTFSTLAKQHPKRLAEQVILSSLRHPQDNQSDIAFLLNTVGKLWLSGGQIDWSGFYTDEHRHRLPLPTYPFERQRYWIDPPHIDQNIQPKSLLETKLSKTIESKANVLNNDVSPSNELEQTIANIWTQFLGKPVGIFDNFFELGGDSLIAVPLLIQLRDTFQKSFSLQSLLQAPTVAQFAELIAENRLKSPRAPLPIQAQMSSSLVEIQPMGSKRPFFCIHPIGGNVLCYAKLAYHLGMEQPFYGLQAKGLEGQERPITQIEEMATQYIKALKVVQPQGPYLLGGWSFGGIVAFEMALQLQKQQDKIALLALIDSVPIVGSQTIKLDDITLLAWFAVDLGLCSNAQQVTLLLNSLGGLMPEEQLRYLLVQAKQANLLPTTAELDDIRPLVQIFKNNVQALQNYVPKVYSNRITLFHASESLSFFQVGESFDGSLIEPMGSIVKWGKLSSEPIEIYTISGNHYTIMTEPHVKHLAEQLKRCINNIHLN